MTDKVINPFKQTRKIDWSKKVHRRYEVSPENSNFGKNCQNSQIKRVAKSFKIFPGKISREFDKRVNKLQVHFDNLDMPKDYVDSGKYLMFIMSFAEKYGLYELYSPVDIEGNFNIEKDKIKKHFEEIIKKL